MKNTDANYYRTNRIIFLVMVVVGIACYSLLWILDWDFNRNSTSLIALQEDNISEIKIFNEAEPTEPPYRELILSDELSLVINLNNGDRPIELVLNLPKDCGQTVYISIVKKPGGVESYLTSYEGGARSKIDLYKWLQNLRLLSYLGCN